MVLTETTPPRQQHPSDGPEMQLPVGLTEREFSVVELLGSGMTNEEIAKELYLSINSIKTYVRTAYRKLGVTDRQQALLWTAGHGLSGGPDRR